MEPIQASLKKWMRENKNFQENFNHIKKELLRDPEISNILSNNPEFTSSDIDKNLMKLYEYRSQSKNCADCPSLDKCINMLPGYTPQVLVEGKDVHLTYDKCKKKIQRDEQQKKETLVKSLYMPKDILEASIDDLDHHELDRHDAIREVLSYVQSIGTNKAEKGLYFYGPFGVGKTYFLGAIANELADRNISSMLIYMPEFVREMKSSLKDDSVNTKIEYFKKVQVLMIDDIGAESLSAWFRDEILGSILQYRMMERLPVFFSSNYSLKQLEQHLATSNRGDTDLVKAGRIIERIKQVSKEVPLFGLNRRDL
ncbi:primosomal protein DnaI [Aquibacillus rhizosphaerae]|uniref:Primosomal protein DnaI n=1 Tax=Aquibacillus rhizosphaerae TaxID=3051431 RepID=A0ABT7L453_9BACI|nr:primosomal protein DnaI [Aquibacillus sp. LR5S19]MDL4840645.1 primosomal protein DnaI [Aquibacillus sp. LR5S19]